MERIFSVLEAKLAAGDISVRTSDVDVYVASAQKNFLEERMKICTELWNAGIKVILLMTSRCDVRTICTVRVTAES